MSYTLFGTMIRKLKSHFKGLKQLRKKFNGFIGNWIAWPLISILLSIGLFFPAAMHFLFESVLFIFNRKQFKRNLVKINVMMNEKQKTTYNTSN